MMLYHVGEDLMGIIVFVVIDFNVLLDDYHALMTNKTD